MLDGKRYYAEGCCARAESGRAAAPPRSVMNARRFTGRRLPYFHRKNTTPTLRQETVAVRDFRSGLRPLRVRSLLLPHSN
jgi:hypothetical protein